MTLWAQNVEKKNIKIGSLLVSEIYPWYDTIISVPVTHILKSLYHYQYILWQVCDNFLCHTCHYDKAFVKELSHSCQCDKLLRYDKHTHLYTHTHMYTHTHTHAHIPALFQRYSMDVYLRFKIGSNKCCVVTICNWSHSHAHIIHTHDYTHTHTYWHTHIHPHWYTHMHWYTNTHKMY
jgi:hypothetical protein